MGIDAKKVKKEAEKRLIQVVMGVSSIGKVALKLGGATGSVTMKKGALGGQIEQVGKGIEAISDGKWLKQLGNNLEKEIDKLKG